MKHLPNLLTALRVVLALFVFLVLVGQAGALSWVGPGLETAAFAAFVLAAVTDFFDGWLARRWQVVSMLGRILDPIADKLLVCVVVLGLLPLLGAGPVGSLGFALPAGLILFREFAVSALREVAAGHAVTLPVTLLAKWKTTLQLVALTAEFALAEHAALGLPTARLGVLTEAAHGLLWLAAVVTLITGAQYALQAAKALGANKS